MDSGLRCKGPGALLVPVPVWAMIKFSEPFSVYQTFCTRPDLTESPPRPHQPGLQVPVTKSASGRIPRDCMHCRVTIPLAGSGGLTGVLSGDPQQVSTVQSFKGCILVALFPSPEHPGTAPPEL